VGTRTAPGPARWCRPPAALNAAVKQRKFSYNPCVGVELEPGERTEARRWTAAEAARFIAAVSDDPMGLMFRIAILAGVRRGELVGLRWTGADLDRGVLTQTAVYVREAGGAS
jgi:integrase